MQCVQKTPQISLFSCVLRHLCLFVSNYHLHYPLNPSKPLNLMICKYICIMEFSRNKHVQHFVLMRYMEDIVKHKPFRSMYALLKASNMRKEFHTNVKRFVSGKNTYPKYITLDIFIRLYTQHKVPFDLSVYLDEYNELFPS